MTRKTLWHWGWLCLSLSLGACSSDMNRTDFAEKAQQESNDLIDKKDAQWRQLNEVAPLSYLTDLIQDSQLELFIQQGLAANPDLQKTLLTLKASAWQLKSTHGDRLPSIDAGFSRNKTESIDASYNADISISWEADFWGKLANTEEAAAKSLAADQALFQESQDALVANIMKSWLAMTSKQHLIDIESQRLAVLETNENRLLQRFKNGLNDLEELDEAQTASSQSRADLAQLKEELAIERRTLQRYLGSEEALTVAANLDYPAVGLTLEHLPKQSLQRRPDLKAAYFAIQAADLSVTVAYKDMLPSISLSATLSDTANSPSSALFTSPVWSLLAQLTQPLYQGGKLKAAVEIAKLNTAQAYQDYRSTLLTAVNEVESTIGQEQVLTQQISNIQQALQSSRNNLSRYEQKYRTGLVELSDLIRVQETTFNLAAELDNLHYQHLINRVDLGLALGLGVKES